MNLQDWRPVSQLKVKETPLTRAKIPVIDAHCHLRGVKDAGKLVAAMDEFNIRAIVHLDGVYKDGGFYREQAKFVGAYPDRFAVLCQIDIAQIDDPEFGRKMSAHITACVNSGARGVKLHKSMVGLHAKDAAGNFVMPDDPRLAAVWDAAAKNNVPVLIHIADPAAFFLPTDEYNERFEELHEHPNWSYYNAGTPGFEALLAAQERMLKANPQTDYVVAHVGSHAEDLADVARMLDLYPNMYVDTAERIHELGRQPYTARDFLIKYADRVLYGTDLVPNAHNTGYNYRFFETRDEYFPYNRLEEHNQGRWMIYGVYLPDEVLQKIYVNNAERLYFRK